MSKKGSTKKYGKLPAKEAEAIPWERVKIDLVSPKTVLKIGKKTYELLDVTMI